MAIDPKMGFQIGSSLLNVGSALFGGKSNANSVYQQGEVSFGAAQQMQRNSIDMQGQLYDQQAQIALDEGAEAARVKAMEARQFAEQQALTYSGNGVLLAGTPMKVVNHTRIEAKKEVEYITRAAAAQANMLRTQKTIMMNEGRAGLLAQSMNFNAQKTQAAMAASANKSGGLQSILSSLGGLVGGTAPGGIKAGAGLGSTLNLQDPFNSVPIQMPYFSDPLKGGGI